MSQYDNSMFKVYPGPHPFGEQTRELLPPYSCGTAYRRGGYTVLRMEMGRSRYEYDIIGDGDPTKPLWHCKLKREAVAIVDGLTEGA